MAMRQIDGGRECCADYTGVDTLRLFPITFGYAAEVGVVTG